MLTKITTLAILLASGSLLLANHYPSAGREIPVPFPPQASQQGNQHSPDIACIADECLVVWMSFDQPQADSYRIRGARVSKTGQALDGSSFTIATAGWLNTSRPQVTAVRSGYAVFYGGGLYATVSREGRVLSRDLMFSFSNRLVSIIEAATAGGSVLLYWQANQGPLIPFLTLLNDELKETRDITVDGYPHDIATTGTEFIIASAAVEGLKVTRLGSDGSFMSATVIPRQLQKSQPVLAATAESVLVAWRRTVTDTTPAAIEMAAITSRGVEPLQVLEEFVASGTASSLDVAATGRDFLVTWSRASSGYYTDNVYIQRVGSSGQRTDPRPLTVSSRRSLQLHAKAAAVDGGYLVAWSDSRFGLGHDHVFAANVTTQGGVGADFLVSRSGTAQSNAALAVSNDGVTGVVWSESTASGAGAVMFTRADRDAGVISAPIRLSESGGAPSIASRGNAFAVAWRDTGAVAIALVSDGHVRTTTRIEAQPSSDISVASSPDDFAVVWSQNGNVMWTRVSADGAPLEGAPIVIGSGTEARIAFDGVDYWIVARAHSGAVQAWRVSRSGVVIDTIPFTVASDGADRDQLALACGERACVALWRTHGDAPSVDGALLTTSGAVPGIVAARGADVTSPALAWTGTSYVLTWAAQKQDEDNYDIHVAQLSSSGNLLGATAEQSLHRIGASDIDERFPAVANAGRERVFAFSRTSNDGGERIYLRFEGEAPRRRSVGR